MPVTIARKALSGFAAATAVAMSLSACSPSDGADNAGSTSASPSSSKGSPSAATKSSSKVHPASSRSASPTPVAASSDGPAKNWPVPKMPAEAKKHSLKGAAAFAEYYFSLVEYTSTTTKTTPIKRHTSHSCSSCQEDIIAPSDHNRKNHAWNAGGTYKPTITAAQNSDDGYTTVAFRYLQSRRVVYDAEGNINEVYDATKKPVYGTFRVVWKNGWTVQAIDIVRK